ncbi:MAG: hypothetical protein VR70_00675 [Rhodospirillaceae bacterium BRH_c57]|nr:MAG: hypothetical protein VR70_00675 [Rhodospirillaceae bacterium BRH_c57]
MLAIILITGIGVGLSAYLNYAKFEGTFTDIEASRYRFINADIAVTLEREMDFGIDLARISNAEGVLSAAQEQDRKIRGAVIFDVTGKILFQVGDPLTAIPDPWLGALRVSDNGRFRGDTPDSQMVGEVLISNFGVPVGAVAIIYSRQYHDIEIAAMGRVLLYAALYVLLIAALMSYLGVRWAIRPAGQRISTMDNMLNHKADTGPEDADLAVQVASADANVTQALQDLEAVERKLKGTVGAG